MRNDCKLKKERNKIKKKYIINKQQAKSRVRFCTTATLLVVQCHIVQKCTTQKSLCKIKSKGRID